LKKSPLQYYAYVGFPIFFWKTVFQNSNTLFSHVKEKSLWSFSFKILAYILGLELLVLSYFERSALSYSLIAFSVLVPIYLGSRFCIKNGLLVLYWSISCLITSIFTFLPVSKEENIYLVSAGALVTCLSGAFFLIYLPKSKSDDASFFERGLIKIQVFFLEIMIALCFTCKLLLGRGY
jgi:phosphatidylinositol glycan class N